MSACEHGTPYPNSCNECVEELLALKPELKQEIPNCIHEKPFNKCGFCSTSDWQA